MTGLTHRLDDSSITYKLSVSSNVSFLSAKGTLLGVWQMGCTSAVSIVCSTTFTSPHSPSSGVNYVMKLCYAFKESLNPLVWNAVFWNGPDGCQHMLPLLPCRLSDCSCISTSLQSDCTSLSFRDVSAGMNFLEQCPFLIHPFNGMLWSTLSLTLHSNTVNLTKQTCIFHSTIELLKFLGILHEVNHLTTVLTTFY